MAPVIQPVTSPVRLWPMPVRATYPLHATRSTLPWNRLQQQESLSQGCAPKLHRCKPLHTSVLSTPSTAEPNQEPEQGSGSHHSSTEYDPQAALADYEDGLDALVRAAEENAEQLGLIEAELEGLPLDAVNDSRHSQGGELRHAEEHVRPGGASSAQLASTSGAPEETSALALSAAPAGRGYDGVKRHGTHIRLEDVKVWWIDTKKTIFKSVENANLELRAGSVNALIGPSGSGKSTLLRAISGLESLTAGRVFYDGVNVTNMPVKDRNIGMVFQGYALFKHKTVAENVAFGMRMRKMDRTVDINKRVQELLQLVEMQDFAGRYPSQLSGGQRQRVALARAIAPNPRLLLMDEPFAALDPTLRYKLRINLQKVIDEMKMTVIIVTHDLGEAFQLADHVVLFNRGKVIQEGPPQELVERPNSPFARHFLQDMNCFPSDCQFVKRMGVSTPKGWVMCNSKDVAISTTPPPPESGIGPVQATVLECRDVLYCIKFYLEFDDDQQLEMQCTEAEYEAKYTNILQGDRVYVQVPASAFHEFEYEEIDFDD